MEWEGCSLCRGVFGAFMKVFGFFIASSSKKNPLISSEDKKLKTWKDIIKCFVLFEMNFMRLVFIYFFCHW